MEPDLTSDEAARLAALYRLDLLDTPPEERFDRITRLISKALGTKMAAFSLIDAERQFFKSRVGLDVSETPRDIAFCNLAVAQDAALVVEDATADERFKKNPLVTGDLNLRFYAGIPVHSLDGQPLGTLCALHDEPRPITPDQLAVLEDAAIILEGELHRIELGSALDASAATQDALRGLVRMLPTAVFVVQPDGEVLASNDAARALTGGLYDGEPFLQAVLPDDAEVASQIMRGGGPKTVRFRGSGGEVVSARLVATSMPTGNMLLAAQPL